MKGFLFMEMEEAVVLLEKHIMKGIVSMEIEEAVVLSEKHIFESGPRSNSRLSWVTFNKTEPFPSSCSFIPDVISSNSIAISFIDGLYFLSKFKHLFTSFAIAMTCRPTASALTLSSRISNNRSSSMDEIKCPTIPLGSSNGPKVKIGFLPVTSSARTTPKLYTSLFSCKLVRPEVLWVAISKGSFNLRREMGLIDVYGF